MIQRGVGGCGEVLLFYLLSSLGGLIGVWSELKGRGGEAIRDSFSPMDGQRVDEGNGMGRGGEKERGEGGEEQVVGWVQFGRGESMVRSCLNSVR